MWVPTLLGVLVLGYGIAAYRGVNRRWVLTGWPRPEASFGMAYAGLAFLLVWPMTTLLLSQNAWAVVVGVALALAAGAGLAVMALSLFWLPASLLPRWYRRLRDLELPRA